MARMAERIRHRGPDGDGYFVDDGVGLAHRRLSIIDMEGGKQPLSNEDSSIWVTFNGEIYNYRELSSQLKCCGHQFRTASDTEVLVHAYEEWGTAFVERLRGMFALAIWDSNRRCLVLARDRIGIKPLVWKRTDEYFAFASELQSLKALAAEEEAINLEAADLYLHFQYIPAPQTIYKNIFKLPPGTTLTVQSDGAMTGPTRYWALSFNPDYGPSEEEWCERLDVELREAIQCHLVSDVDFGAFLSGGVDSSTVVAYMAEVLGRPVKTFSIAFDEARCDESSYARDVAAKFQTEHHEEVVRPEALAILPELVRHYGEPFADSSAVPTWYVSRLAARHVKMVLSGDGGDENFAGYGSYPGVLRQHPGPRGLVKRLRFILGTMARSLGLRPPLPSPCASWYASVAYFNESERASLWRPEFRHLLDGTWQWMSKRYEDCRQRELCSHLQRLDFDTYLPYDILTKVDIASMCHGLEVRVPLLDHKLVEMIASIPSKFKLTGALERDETAVGKYILKRSSSRFFSEQFLHRPKKGFEVPIREWFGGATKGMLYDRLLDKGSTLHEWFDIAYIRGLIEGHGNQHASHLRIWALLFLDEWFRQRGSSRTRRDGVNDLSHAVK